MFDRAVLIQQRRKIKFGESKGLDENKKQEHGMRNFSRFFIGK